MEIRSAWPPSAAAGPPPPERIGGGGPHHPVDADPLRLVRDHPQAQLVEGVRQGLAPDAHGARAVRAEGHGLRAQRRVGHEVHRLVVALAGVELVDEGAGVGDAAGRRRRRLVFGGEGRGVPAHDGLAGVRAEVEGEHLAVEVLADGHLVAALGVGDGEGVGDLHPIALPLPEQGPDHAAGPLLPPRVVVQHAQEDEGVDVDARDREARPPRGVRGAAGGDRGGRTGGGRGAEEEGGRAPVGVGGIVGDAGGGHDREVLAGAGDKAEVGVDC